MVMSRLVREAFETLYNRQCSRSLHLKYSRAFKGYNANVKYTRDMMEFRLSYNWKEVSDEIKIGLIQHLLNKVYDTDVPSLNIELYDIFLKKIPKLTKKGKAPPTLLDSFKRVNEKYFSGMILRPDLEWGNESHRKLGSYDFNTDTIRISTIIQEEPLLLDYVMYHELLHKKLKYQEKNGRSYHHTSEFRQKEQEFDDPEIETKLKRFLRKKRTRKILGFW